MDSSEPEDWADRFMPAFIGHLERLARRSSVERFTSADRDQGSDRSGAVSEWAEIYIEDPGQARQFIISSMLKLADQEQNSDLFRLAHLLNAYERQLVADRVSPDLPDKPGKMSAYAISSIVAQRWSPDTEGNLQAPHRRRPHGTDAQPAEAGRRWLNRLRKRLDEAEGSGSIEDIDQFMLNAIRELWDNAHD